MSELRLDTIYALCEYIDYAPIEHIDSSLLLQVSHVANSYFNGQIVGQERV